MLLHMKRARWLPRVHQQYLARPLSTTSPDYPPPTNSSLPAQPFSTAHSHTAAGAQDEVSRLAAQPLPEFTLKDLVRHGYPPLTPQALLSSARYTRNLLPLRLARRILALRNLPFIIVSNPHISEIYNNYIHSLRLILTTPHNHPTTLAEEAVFTSILTEIVKTHANTIPTLAKGFIECKKYIGAEEVTAFLERHLRARIGTRLLAEQHIALRHETVGEDGKMLDHRKHKHKRGGSWQRKKGNRDSDDDDAEFLTQQQKQSSSGSSGPGGAYIGTIDTQLLPSRIISSCSAFVGGICELRYGLRPRLIIDGHTAAVFPYIPVHLEYIITELLKNAFRATIENPSSSAGAKFEDTPTPGAADYDADTGGDPSLPPVTVTLAVTSPTDAGDKVLSIRIRDRGGGISPEAVEHIWKYSFSTFGDANGGAGDEEEQNPMNMNMGMDLSVDGVAAGAGGGSIAGLGYGLPLSRAYAEYFGGSLSLQSCFGWGTDVYLTLKSILEFEIGSTLL
ncbi:pyruvate dehydrogenase kinase [Peziza echinospora]|nr:pyruvate dehydrogenase kinase [Peziza echinospora]